MLEFDEHEAVEFDGVGFHRVLGSDFSQGVELGCYFGHFFGYCVGEFLDKGWRGVLASNKCECLGEGDFIGCVGRRVKLVVLGLHCWLSEDWLVGSWCEWGDGL